MKSQLSLRQDLIRRYSPKMPHHALSTSVGGEAATTRSDNHITRNNQVSRTYFEHSTAKRINTDIVIVDAIRAEYPQLHLICVPQSNCDFLGYAAAGHAALAPIDKESDRLEWTLYAPPLKKLDGGSGYVFQDIKFGKYLLDWQGKEFVMYVVDGRDGAEAWPQVTMQYMLSASVDATEKLLKEAGIWANEIHDQVWVFDQGYWEKSTELWNSVQEASWDNVILKEPVKEAIIDDVINFFDNRDTYRRLKVPWKRGIIYYGPPGNGKTISIKAMMHTLYKREPQIPTLYVKTLTSFFGPEESINQIFKHARANAPCYLVFEDLDSIVSDEVRSFFLNAVDGISQNDGVLMVGSTNHLDRLDPGIAKRPSRFDRKYLFPNPDMEQRIAYMEFWQRKLEDSEVEFPDKICPAVAKITKGFSFAYLQEAIVSALLAIARDSKSDFEACIVCMESHCIPGNRSRCDRVKLRERGRLHDWTGLVRELDEGEPDLDEYILWREIKKQVRILREELDAETGIRD